MTFEATVGASNISVQALGATAASVASLSILVGAVTMSPDVRVMSRDEYAVFKLGSE